MDIFGFLLEVLLIQLAVWAVLAIGGTAIPEKVRQIIYVVDVIVVVMMAFRALGLTSHLS